MPLIFLYPLSFGKHPVIFDTTELLWSIFLRGRFGRKWHWKPPLEATFFVSDSREHSMKVNLLLDASVRHTEFIIVTHFLIPVRLTAIAALGIQCDLEQA